MRSSTRRPIQAARTPALLGLLVGSLLLMPALPALAVEADVLVVTRAIAAEGAPPNLGTATPSSFAPSLPPDGRALLAVDITNTASVAVTALVYGADVDGLEVSPGFDDDGVGSWITTDDRELELEPGATHQVELLVERPADDTAGGQGAVVVQLSDDSRIALGLAGVTRAAIPVDVAADGSGETPAPGAVELDVQLGLIPGTTTATVSFTNSGAKAVAARARLRVTGVPDAPVFIDLGRVRVRPGDVVEQSVALPDVRFIGGLVSVSAEIGDDGLRSASPVSTTLIAPLWAVATLVLLTLAFTVRTAGRARAARARSAATRPPPLGLEGDATDEAVEGDDLVDEADDETELEVIVEILPSD